VNPALQQRLLRVAKQLFQLIFSRSGTFVASFPSKPAQAQPARSEAIRKRTIRWG